MHADMGHLGQVRLWATLRPTADRMSQTRLDLLGPNLPYSQHPTTLPSCILYTSTDYRCDSLWPYTCLLLSGSHCTDWNSCSMQ